MVVVVPPQLSEATTRYLNPGARPGRPVTQAGLLDVVTVPTNTLNGSKTFTVYGANPLVNWIRISVALIVQLACAVMLYLQE